MSRGAPWPIDPDDPRAPPQELWDGMTLDERRDVVNSLPHDFPPSEAYPPEGDPHIDNWAVPRRTLRRWSKSDGRKMYVGGNMAIYYPGEPMFSPDLFAVLDVPDHDRNSWVVSHEKRGLDLALEVIVSGRRRKDLEDNVARYARLGISEYFVVDWSLGKIHGYRLADERDAGTYQRLVPQSGRFASRVLGLDLLLMGGRLHFARGEEFVLHDDELIVQLQRLISDAEARATERLAIVEAELAQERQRREAEEQRREALERELAELRARLNEKG